MFKGGQSAGDWYIDEAGHLVLECNIVNTTADFYFCSTVIDLRADNMGVDVSRYNNMIVEMEFTSTRHCAFLSFTQRPRSQGRLA
jgi:hypothetical protein